MDMPVPRLTSVNKRAMRKIVHALAGTKRADGKYHFDVWQGELVSDLPEIPPPCEISFRHFSLVATEWNSSGLYHRSALSVRQHERRFFTMTFVEGGEILISQSERTIRITPDVFSITRMDTGYNARFMPYPGRTLKTLTLRVPSCHLLPYIAEEEVREHPIRHHKGSSRFAQRILKDIFQFSDDITGSIFADTVALLIKSIVSSLRSPGYIAPVGESAEDRHFNAITNFIDSNIGKDINAKLLASRLGISTRYVSKILSSRGETIPTLIRRKRVELAKSIIIANSSRHSLTLKELASVCGFKNYSHFIRVFREFTGDTPHGLRQAVSLGGDQDRPVAGLQMLQKRSDVA